MPQAKIIQMNQQSYSAYKKSQKEQEADKKEKRTGDYTYGVWHSRIESTLNWRKRYWNGDDNWDNAYRMFKGKHYRDQNNDNPSSDDPRDLITVNITGSTIQNVGPFLLNSKVKFQCKPRKPDENVSAMIQESLLNYHWNQQKMQYQVRRALDDAMIIGHGIVKNGFNLEIDESLKESDGEINYRDYIKAEHPYARRINPKNFVFDPCAPEHNLATARWVSEVFYAPVVDILSNASYDQSVIRQIKAGRWTIKDKTILNIESDMYDWMDDGKYNVDDNKVGILYEIWDKKFQKYYVFAAGVRPPLIEKDWPYPYLTGFPYDMLDFIRLNDEPYGIGIPYMIADQQYELNRKRTSLFYHSRINNRKYEVLNSVSDESKLALEEGADGTIVTVDMMGSIQPIHDLPISNDVYQLEAIIKDDIRQLTGADALIQGGSLPSRTTAGEINARGNLFRAKLDDRITNVDDFILSIGNKILDHLKANLLTEQVVRIVGREGEFWQEFTVDDIQDDVDITMESVAAPKVDPVLDRQQALQVLQLSMQALPLIQAGALQLNMNELYKWVFEKMDITDAGRFFAPSNMPIQPLGQQQLPAAQQQTQPNLEQTQQTDIQKQAGLAPLLNESGLQI